MADTIGAATGIGLFWCLEIVYRRVLRRRGLIFRAPLAFDSLRVRWTMVGQYLGVGGR